MFEIGFYADLKTSAQHPVGGMIDTCQRLQFHFVGILKLLSSRNSRSASKEMTQCVVVLVPLLCFFLKVVLVPLLCYFLNVFLIAKSDKCLFNVAFSYYDC